MSITADQIVGATASVLKQPALNGEVQTWFQLRSEEDDAQKCEVLGGILANAAREVFAKLGLDNRFNITEVTVFNPQALPRNMDEFGKSLEGVVELSLGLIASTYGRDAQRPTKYRSGNIAQARVYLKDVWHPGKDAVITIQRYTYH